MKKIIDISLIIALVISAFILLGFVNHKQKQVPFQSLKIHIDRQFDNYFVLEEDVQKTFKKLGYGSPEQPMGKIDITHFEEALRKNPFVKKVNVFTTIDGNITVNIKQKKPLIRVFSKNKSFYIDEQGWILPLSNQYTARVLVASGNIQSNFPINDSIHVNQLSTVDSLLKPSVFSSLYKLALYLDNNRFWKAQINQAYINENQEIELIPRVGNHTLLIGNGVNLDDKFKKLWIFYQKGLSKTGWNEFSVINLKYKNQVVCTKRN